MKKYRLKQWYPGLSKDWIAREIILEYDKKIRHYVFYGDKVYIIPAGEVENNPDFWEEIIEKEPLFVTEDGVEVFEGQGYWEVTEKFRHDWYVANIQGEIGNNKRFSSKKAAEAWIKENKPVFSRKEIREAIDSISYEHSFAIQLICNATTLKEKLNL